MASFNYKMKKGELIATVIMALLSIVAAIYLTIGVSWITFAIIAVAEIVFTFVHIFAYDDNSKLKKSKVFGFITFMVSVILSGYAYELYMLAGGGISSIAAICIVAPIFWLFYNMFISQ